MAAPLAGEYNWDFVFGLEQIVQWCKAHGVKVLFTVLDNWSPVDSKTAVRWPRDQGLERVLRNADALMCSDSMPLGSAVGTASGPGT